MTEGVKRNDHGERYVKEKREVPEKGYRARDHCGHDDHCQGPAYRARK